MHKICKNCSQIKSQNCGGDREHRFRDYMKIYVQLTAFGCERGTTQVGFNKFDYERGEGHGGRGKWKTP